MKYLQKHWRSRTAIVLFLSTIVGLLLISLELTAWAAQINHQGYSHGAGEEVPRMLEY